MSSSATTRAALAHTSLASARRPELAARLVVGRRSWRGKRVTIIHLARPAGRGDRRAGRFAWTNSWGALGQKYAEARAQVRRRAKAD